MAAEPRSAPIVAFGGGKGGVGKSLIAANVAIFLAQLGKRVVLLDAAIGGPNLHNFLGQERPKRSFARLLSGEVPSILECLNETQIAGLTLLSLDFDDPSWQSSRSSKRRKWIDEIRHLECDFVVVDLGPVANWVGLDLFLLADCGVLVTLPEPASVEATYRFIVSAFQRRLRRHDNLPPLWARARRDGAPLLTPLDLFQLAVREEPGALNAIRSEISALRPRIIVNVTRSRSDLDLGHQIQTAGRRGLGLPIDDFGHVESDDAVLIAVRRRRPVVVDHPESKAAKNLERIARRIIGEHQAERAHAAWQPRAMEEHTYYEVLESDPGASEEELRRAHRRVREIFSDDALAICGLFSEDRLTAIQRRIQEAYDTLLDPSRRHRYDLERFPEGQPRRRLVLPRSDEFQARPISQINQAVVPMVGPAPSSEPELSSETEFTGPLLRRIREARGIEIEDIAQRTKIMAAHLRAIEAEQFTKLPAPVYVRGFVVELAKFLRLEPIRVATSYMKRIGSGT